MRQVACDDKTCILQPVKNLALNDGDTKESNMLGGGGGGLAPEQNTFYVPLKGNSSKPIKRRKRSSQTGGKIKSVPVTRVKKGRIKKKKRHSKKVKSRRRKGQTGGKNKKQQTGGRRRKCVKKK